MKRGDQVNTKAQFENNPATHSFIHTSYFIHIPQQVPNTSKPPTPHLLQPPCPSKSHSHSHSHTLSFSSLLNPITIKKTDKRHNSLFFLQRYISTIHPSHTLFESNSPHQAPLCSAVKKGRRMPSAAQKALQYLPQQIFVLPVLAHKREGVSQGLRREDAGLGGGLVVYLW